MPSQHPEARKLISQGVFDSIKSFKDFEERVTKLIETNTTLGGDAFEIFVEAYLINQPKMQCAKVFVVKQLPLDISKELNLPNDGKGVDGVYKSFSEISVPYQVKFRSNRPPLSLTEVSTFLGLTERAKDRVLITNCDEIARDVKNRDYLRSIRGQDFDLLEEADFELIEAWLKEKPVKRELPKPKPYQLIALEGIKKALGSHDRATVVMACGTGKTLIALWAAEQAEANTVLVLLPSLTLMQQTLLEWSKNNSWGNRFSFICVCSDPTVKANDEIEIDPTDIDFKVDTDPELVKQFLNQKNEKVKVVFSTYQSSKIVGEAIKGFNPFDFAVFDEAHKTTGPKGGVFAFTLDNQNISIKKRLFLTATPRHYDIKKRDKEGEFKVISMDDESIYGTRAHSLSFGSAASQGIICNYKVIISFIDKNQVDDFALKNGITLVENDKIGTRWVASQIALQQAIEKVNASKIITFHSRVKLAQEFSSETSHGIKRYLKDFKVMHVNGEQRSNERTGLLRQFKDSPRSLITNARCLTEGVDVPAVDMVAFIDARHSKVDIAQAIGRAMRKPKGSDKQFGYIVVPLFADTSDLNNLEETIKKEGFDDVAEILNALQEQDEELVDIIKELQEAKGRGEVFNPKRLSEKVETIGPFINLDEIGANVYTEILARFGVGWDFWFGLLQKYYLANNKSIIPDAEDYLGYKLGGWCAHQRRNYRKGILLRGRQEKFKEFHDWTWEVKDQNWLNQFKLMCEFLEKNETIFLTKNLVINGYNIYTFAKTQRSLFVSGDLDSERLDLFNKFKYWSWDPNKDHWESCFKYLEGRVASTGKYNPEPNKKINGRKISVWINGQRESIKDGSIDPDKLKKLKSLSGWDQEDSWDSFYLMATDYYLKVFPKTYLDPVRNSELGDWIHRQRNYYKQKNLLQDRIDRLSSIVDWAWDRPEKTWHDNYKILKGFSDERGHCLIPDDYAYQGRLVSVWATLNRRRFRDGDKSFSIDKINLLKKLPNWFWEERDFFWSLQYNLIKDHLSSNQILVTNIKKDLLLYKFDTSFNVYRWIGTQKDQIRLKKLSSDKIQKLKLLPGIFERIPDLSD